jgi:hypothetical protein
MRIQREHVKPGRAKERLQQIARLLLAIAIGVLVLGAIVYGESWAIREAPPLLTSVATAYSHDSACVTEDNADDGMLPIAVLH